MDADHCNVPINLSTLLNHFNKELVSYIHWPPPPLEKCNCLNTHNNVPTPSQEWHSLPFPDLMAHIPYQFYMKLCEIFLLTQNISKYWIQEDCFFKNNLVLSVVKCPPFLFLNWIIFSTPFEHMKFPTFSWLFDPFPNPSWLFQPIPLPFQGRKKLKSDSWLLQDFPYLWEPCHNDFFNPCNKCKVRGTIQKMGVIPRIDFFPPSCFFPTAPLNDLGNVYMKIRHWLQSFSNLYLLCGIMIYC